MGEKVREGVTICRKNEKQRSRERREEKKCGESLSLQVSCASPLVKNCFLKVMAQTTLENIAVPLGSVTLQQVRKN